MAQFSGAIRISDLNDYISPSQACVVALKGSKLQVTADEEVAGEVALQPPLKQQRSVGIDNQQQAARPHWTQAQAAAPGEAVKVTLHDCLACSGCVTTAETVLLESQSGAELMAKLAEARQAQQVTGTSMDAAATQPALLVVVSVSPQSTAALAALYGMSASEAFARLSGWLLQQGAAAVLDVRLGRDLALMETAAEFVERYRSSHQCSTSGHHHLTSTPTGQQQQQQQQPLSLVGHATHAPQGLPSGSAQGRAGVAPRSAAGLLGERGPDRSLPMLASACPGWVCYAEKTHGEFVLPHISTTKSPQAVMGTLVKRLAGSQGVDAWRVCHATIMPCYDKKLEAARDELTLPGGEPEVDCCLTTSEVQKLMAESGVADLRQVPTPGQGPGAATAAAALPQALHDLLRLQQQQLQSQQQQHQHQHKHKQHSQQCPQQGSRQQHLQQHGLLPSTAHDAHAHSGHQNADAMQLDGEEPATSEPTSSTATTTREAAVEAAAAGSTQWLGFQGIGGSGGYMEYVFRAAAKELFGVDVPPGPLPLKVLKNSDFQEVVLESPSGSGAGPLLRCAQAYGFRNIQSLIRKVKAGKSEYHFIEVMACPSGCLNGGGQLKAQQGETPAQQLERLEQLYFQDSSCRPETQVSRTVQQLYEHWVQGPPGSDAAKALLHTSYRKRERTVGVLASDW